MYQFIIALVFLLALIGAYYLFCLWANKSPTKLEDANRKIGELQGTLKQELTYLENAKRDIAELTEQFEKLRFSKISGDVKLGQKAEHLLPFLEGFPYKDDEIKGLFQPVDLIVFRQDEVVFVEIKTGTSSLTEKERRIRDNIKAGRVRFEVHRLNEKGITVK